jgi:hypothetical protein
MACEVARRYSGFPNPRPTPMIQEASFHVSKLRLNPAAVDVGPFSGPPGCLEWVDAGCHRPAHALPILTAPVPLERPDAAAFPDCLARL